MGEAGRGLQEPHSRPLRSPLLTANWAQFLRSGPAAALTDGRADDADSIFGAGELPRGTFIHDIHTIRM